MMVFYIVSVAALHVNKVKMLHCRAITELLVFSSPRGVATPRTGGWKGNPALLAPPSPRSQYRSQPPR